MRRSPDGEGGRYGRGLGRALVLTLRDLALALALLVLSVLTLAALALVVVVVGVYLYPACLWALRGRAIAHAELEGRAGLVSCIPPLPEETGTGFRARVRHTLALLSDAAAWRILAWGWLEAHLGILLAGIPLGVIAWGVRGLVVLPVLNLLGAEPSEWYVVFWAEGAETLPITAVLGAALLLIGLVSVPWWRRLRERCSALPLLVGPEELRERVGVLTESRAQARDDAAAELRRIEREVHDGTQSQLVAIGLTLGTAEALLAEDPERARALIEQAREDSSAALAELRDLMRGIRPPLLADRGLAAALEALALDAATAVTTRIEIPDRVDPSLESAVYFSVRELVTNALKHSGASNVEIDARIDGGLLTIVVADDGNGGAVAVPGHGLDGVRRRMAAFDGALALESPVRGPTVARIEVPCAS